MSAVLRFCAAFFPDACTFEVIEAAVGEQAQERFDESVQRALLET